MKKLFYLTLALFAWTACGTSNTEDNDPWGTIDPGTANKQSAVVEFSMDSKAMGRKMHCQVWLPANYDKKETYPFLYLLHGYETSDQNGRFDRCWLDKGNAAKIADDYQKANGVPMVIVMPNGLDKFYMSDGYEEYFETELMPQIEAEYGCNGKRGISGLSMGGFGTLYHALKYPSKFTYAYAMSPAVDMSMAQMVSGPDGLPGITIETGENDYTTQLSSITPFVNAMKGKGVEIDLITRAGGHEWPFWQVCLPKALIKIGQSFK